MAKRVYKRDAQGRFAGGSGGGSRGGARLSATKQKLRKAGRVIAREAKKPENQKLALDIVLTATVGSSLIRQSAAINSSQNAARRAAQDRVARTSGIGSGSATLKAARQRRGVYQL